MKKYPAEMPVKLGYALSNVKVMVLVSGGGSNLQVLLDAEKSGVFAGGSISLVVSDRPGVFALERAQTTGVKTFVAEPNKNIPKEQRRQELSDRILGLAANAQIDLIVLAGFLSILAGDIVEEYSGRMINIHPALLPKFGGEGMYGEHVHRAVLAAGETESGCTVHLVDAGTDTGPTLLQRKVPVLPGDTPASLAERILREEHIAIVEGVNMIIEYKIGEVS